MSCLTVEGASVLASRVGCAPAAECSRVLKFASKERIFSKISLMVWLVPSPCSMMQNAHLLPRRTSIEVAAMVMRMKAAMAAHGTMSLLRKSVKPGMLKIVRQTLGWHHNNGQTVSSPTRKYRGASKDSLVPLASSMTSRGTSGEYHSAPIHHGQDLTCKSDCCQSTIVGSPMGMMAPACGGSRPRKMTWL